MLWGINMHKIRKVFKTVERYLIQRLLYVNSRLYMKLYLNYLKKRGMDIKGKPNYIGENVYFDGADYSKINLNDNVTISREVMFLTHDYSMHTVYKGLDIENLQKVIDKDNQDSLLILKGISVGKNSFIGARSSLLPGTKIGDNVLVGACSVVRGNIPDNSIVMGNPAKIVGNTDKWIDRKILQMSSEI